MKLVLFTKSLRSTSVDQLIEIAGRTALDGYDLCVRPGYPVSPENVGAALPNMVRDLRSAGIDVPMITADTSLLNPDDPSVPRLLAAMDKAEVRLLKMGYFPLDPDHLDYLAEIGRVRGIFHQWVEKLKPYGVRVCYHTHSDRNLGLNCAALAHLLADVDARYLGAYIDPGHMVIEGEDFATGAAMVSPYLCAVGMKDVLITRQEYRSHGIRAIQWVPAGKGMVDWSLVFRTLSEREFTGPLSVHCEFDIRPQELLDAIQQEVSAFRRMQTAAAS